MSGGAEWFREKERADGRWKNLCEIERYIERAKNEVHGPEVDALIDALELLVPVLREISMAIERL